MPSPQTNAFLSVFVQDETDLAGVVEKGPLWINLKPDRCHQFLIEDTGCSQLRQTEALTSTKNFHCVCFRYQSAGPKSGHSL